MAIRIRGPILDFLRQKSALISELLFDDGGEEIILEKPDDLSNKEWNALRGLLEPGEAPLLIRSHGRSVANPLSGLSKASINRMIDFLLIDDEPTFRRIVQAVNLPATVSAPATEAVYNAYYNNNNGVERAGPIGFNLFNFNNDIGSNNNNNTRPNIVVNNSEYNRLQQRYAKPHTRRHKKHKKRTKRRQKSYSLLKSGMNMLNNYIPG